MDPTRSVLVYDGACGFCTWTVGFVRDRSVEAVDIVPWQRAELEGLGLSEAEARDAAWWVDADGEAHRGARAVARALRACPFPWSALGRMMQWPLLRSLSDFAYAFVSRHRGRLPGTTPVVTPKDDVSDR